MTAPQERVQALVDHHGAVTSEFVSRELSVSRGWAARILDALVRAGRLTPHHAGGGTYEWSRADADE